MREKELDRAKSSLHWIIYMCENNSFINRELEQGEEFLALNFLYVSKLYSYHREIAWARIYSH